jgi:steroid delta-isomerase-like uncharacterized protein
MGTGKRLWRRGELATNKQDYPAMAALYTPEAVYVRLSHPAVRGREAIQAYLEEADKPFSDIRLETSVLIEERNIVTAEWTWRATHTAPLALSGEAEVPATGKTVEIFGVSVCEIADGKFAGQRDYYDSAVMMAQMGLMPGA